MNELDKIMNPPPAAPREKNPALAGYLRQAADKIETHPYLFSWTRMERCNCGILAQCVMGCDGDYLFARRGTQGFGDNWSGLWSEIPYDRFTCPITDLPAKSIIGSLRAVGLTGQDLYDLEMLDAQDIIDHVKESGTDGEIDDWNQASRPCVIAYMRAWADLIS